MGGAMHYVQADNAAFVQHLARMLGTCGWPPKEAADRLSA
jgi:hypothetical protein